MSDSPAIEIRNVSKLFQYNDDQPKTVLESAISLFSRRQPPKPLWALQDVDFVVEPGQSVGLIGRNGSGKSTLLKMITGIIRPSQGAIVVRGRVSALLELGAGFHPDLTGRENIYLNGSVLGLTKRQVEARLHEIVTFSELGDFIDMPVKHYSSGMYMRLGFSVAVHVQPDILIVDEILAVGDYAFQTKCLNRIRELQRGGVTIVFVSHHIQTVRQICSHLVWLELGKVESIGLAADVADQYMAQQRGSQANVIGGSRWGSGEVEIVSVRFLNENGKESKDFFTGAKIQIEIDYVAHQPIQNPEFGLAFFTSDGTLAAGPNNRQTGNELGEIAGKGTIIYQIDSLPFLKGEYLVSAAIHDSTLPRAFDYHEKGYSFSVEKSGMEEDGGIVQLPASWRHLPKS